MSTTDVNWEQIRKSHPAKYTPVIQDAIVEIIAGLNDGDPNRLILDPFGGVGGIFDIGVALEVEGARRSSEVCPWVTCVELEPEWAQAAKAHQATLPMCQHVTCGAFGSPQCREVVCADFPEWGKAWPGQFDFIVTSPAYGNRMADNHEAKDSSRRITYRHRLGRALSPNNSGGMQWGKKYREFHEKAWALCGELLCPGGHMILNVKDHVRGGKVQPVSAWHRDVLVEAVGELVDYRQVPVTGMGFGANGHTRVPHEHVYVFRKAEVGSGKAEVGSRKPGSD